MMLIVGLSASQELLQGLRLLALCLEEVEAVGWRFLTRSCMASRLVHTVPGETRDLGMEGPQWHSLSLEGQVQVDTRHVGPKYEKEMLMKHARSTRPIGRRVPALGRWTFCGALDGQQLLAVEGSG